MALPKSRMSKLESEGTDKFSSAALVLTQFEQRHPWVRPEKAGKENRWGKSVGESISTKSRLEIAAELERKEVARSLKANKIKDLALLSGIQVSMYKAFGLNDNQLAHQTIAGVVPQVAAEAAPAAGTVGAALTAIAAQTEFNMADYLNCMIDDYSTLVEKDQYRSPNENTRLEKFQVALQGALPEGFPLTDAHSSAKETIAAGKKLTKEQIKAAQQILLAQYVELLVTKYNMLISDDTAEAAAAKVAIANKLRDILSSATAEADKDDLLAAVGDVAGLQKISAAKLKQIMAKVPALNASGITVASTNADAVNATLLSLPRGEGHYVERTMAMTKARATYAEVFKPRLDASWDGAVNPNSYEQQLQTLRQSIDDTVRNRADNQLSIAKEIQNIIALVNGDGTLAQGQNINRDAAINALGNDSQKRTYTLKQLFADYNKAKDYYGRSDSKHLSTPSGVCNSLDLAKIKKVLAWHIEQRKQGWLQKLDDLLLTTNPDMEGYRQLAKSSAEEMMKQAWKHLSEDKLAPRYETIYPDFPANETEEERMLSQHKAYETAYEAAIGATAKARAKENLEASERHASRVQHYRHSRERVLNQASVRMNARFAEQQQTFADYWMELPDDADVNAVVSSYRNATARILRDSFDAEKQRVETAYDQDLQSVQRSSSEILTERDEKIVAIANSVRHRLGDSKHLLKTLGTQYKDLKGYPLNSALVADIYQLVCGEALNDLNFENLPEAQRLIINAIENALLKLSDVNSNKNFYEALQAEISALSENLDKAQREAERAWDEKRAVLTNAHAEGLTAPNRAYQAAKTAYNEAKDAVTAAAAFKARVEANEADALQGKRERVQAKYQAEFERIGSILTVETWQRLVQQKEQLDTPVTREAVTAAKATDHLTAARAMAKYNRDHIVENAGAYAPGTHARNAVLEAFRLAVEFANGADDVDEAKRELQTNIRNALTADLYDAENLRAAIRAWQAAGDAAAQARATHLNSEADGHRNSVTSLLTAAMNEYRLQPAVGLAADQINAIIEAFLKARAYAAEADDPDPAQQRLQQAIQAALNPPGGDIDFNALRTAIHAWLAAAPVSPLATHLNHAVDANINLMIRRVLRSYHTVRADAFTTRIVTAARAVDTPNCDAWDESKAKLGKINDNAQFKDELDRAVTQEVVAKTRAAEAAIQRADASEPAEPDRTQRLIDELDEAKGHNNHLSITYFGDPGHRVHILASMRVLMAKVVEKAEAEERAAETALTEATTRQTAAHVKYKSNDVATGTTVDAVTQAREALNAQIALGEAVGPFRQAVLDTFAEVGLPEGTDKVALATLICDFFLDNNFDPAALANSHDVLKTAIQAYVGGDEQVNVRDQAEAIATHIVGTNAPAVAGNLDGAAATNFKAAKTLLATQTAEQETAKQATECADAEVERAEAQHTAKQTDKNEKRNWSNSFNDGDYGEALLLDILTIEQRLSNTISTPPRPTGQRLRTLNTWLEAIKSADPTRQYKALCDAAGPDAGPDAPGLNLAAELGRLQANEDNGLTNGMRVLQAIQLARQEGISLQAERQAAANHHNAEALKKALDDAKDLQRSLISPAGLREKIVKEIRTQANEDLQHAQTELRERETELKTARAELSKAMKRVDGSSSTQIKALKDAENATSALAHAKDIVANPRHSARAALEQRLARSEVANFNPDIAKLSALLYDYLVVSDTAAEELAKIMYPNDQARLTDSTVLNNIKKALQQTLIDEPTAENFATKYEALTGEGVALVVADRIKAQNIIDKELNYRAAQIKTLLTVGKVQRQAAVALATTAADLGRTAKDRARVERFDFRSDSEKLEDAAKLSNTSLSEATDARDFIRDDLSRELVDGAKFTTAIKTTAGFLGTGLGAKKFQASFTIASTERGRVSSLSLPSPKSWPKAGSEKEKQIMRDVAKFVDVFVYRASSKHDLHLRGVDMRLAAMVYAYVETSGLKVDIKGVKKFQTDEQVFNRACDVYAKDRAEQRRLDDETVLKGLQAKPSDSDEDREAKEAAIQEYGASTGLGVGPSR